MRRTQKKRTPFEEALRASSNHRYALEEQLEEAYHQFNQERKLYKFLIGAAFLLGLTTPGAIYDAVSALSLIH